jgi:hypothetical protein
MDLFFAHPTWAAAFLIDASLIAPAAIWMDLATAVTVEKAVASSPNPEASAVLAIL